MSDGNGGVPASAGDPGVDFTPEDSSTSIDPADEPDGTTSTRQSSRGSSGGDVPASAGDPGVDVDPETVTGSTTVRATPGTASAESTIPSQGADTNGPGLAARTVDALTDAARVQNPAATGAISATAASLRTESGAPIPGTDRTTPGRRDVDRFTDRLDPTTDRIDRGIERAVDATTIPGGGDSRERGPIREGIFDSEVVPDASGEEIRQAAQISPGFGALAAGLGTEAGRTGARTGVTAGLQTLNPAGVLRDSATFADAGIRATDTALSADDDDIQAGFDTTAAVAETAREQGPPQVAAAFADDPDQFLRAGTAAGAGAISLGVAGIAAPTAAVRGIDRGARRADTSGARRQLDDFLDDDRGQLDGSIGRRDTDTDGTIEIGGEDIAEPRRRDPVVRPDDGPDIDPGSALAGRRQRTDRIARDGPETRGESLIDPTSPSGGERARRQFETPRDPLDTSGTAAFTRADTASPFPTGETAGRGVLTGSAVSSQLDGAETGLFETDLTGLGSDTAPGFGLGQRSGTGIDVTPTPDSGTDVGTTPEIGSEPLSQGDGGQQATGATRLLGASVLDGRQGPVGESTPTFGDPSLGDRTGRPPRRPGRPPTRRPPAVPPVDFPGAKDDEGLEFGTAIDEAVIEQPTRTLDEADALVDDMAEIGRMEGFDNGPP